MLKQTIKKLRRRYGLESKTLHCHYRASGLGVRNIEVDFLEEEPFRTAWAKAAAGAERGWSGLVPDIRWRAHIALWAAQRGLELEGDFVECGVYTGLMSMTICHALDFAKQARNFYLFDTYEGVPLEGLDGEALAIAAGMNKSQYKDVFEDVRRNFAPFPNAKLVRGILPHTLEDAPLQKIAYLSIDLNNAKAERPCIERLWPLMSSGASVVIDDYAHRGHREQFDMWNGFAAGAGAPIVTLPTGQGLMIKP